MPVTEHRPWVDQVESAGREAAHRAQDLIARGNARRAILRDAKGELLVQLPLTVGIVAALILVLSAPWLAVIAGVVGLLAGLHLQVVRPEPPQLPDDYKP